MSRKFTLLIVLILMLVAMAAGCKSGQTKLTAADNGKTIEVKAGHQIIIELEGNPSTGYNWEANNLDAGLIQQVGEPEFKSSSPGLIGSGGSITLTFEILKAGTTTLNLVYHRPWETNVAPLSTFAVTIVAK